MRSAYLGTVCDIEMGQAPKGSSYNGAGEGYPLLAGAGDFGIDSPAPSKFTTEPTKLSRRGDILLCIRATVGDLNWSDRKYCLGRGVAGLRPKNGKVDRGYLWRWLSFARPELEKRARGSTFKQVSRRDISDLEILLPNSLDEQRRIATILDKADAVRRKQAEAYALLQELLKATFLDKFGDPATNMKKLPMVPIKDLGRVVTGNTPPRVEAENYGPGIEWIKSDNINTPHHLLTKAEETVSEKGRSIARIVPAGSTLVTCIAGSPNSIGNAAIADREVAFNQQINAVIPNRDIDPFFLYSQFLVAKKKIQAASTNSMKGMVTKGKFQEIEFILPSISDQKWFGKFFARVMQAAERLHIALADSEALFGGLSQRAFRGEL
jgi:type I restriction enzyme S subunit